MNPRGLHLRSFAEGDEMVARYRPEPHEMAALGFVYGGLIASLVDCHAMGTAAAAAEREAGFAIGARPAPRFVTAALSVDFVAPTPMGAELEVRARAVEVGARKVVVEATVAADGTVTARGRAVAVRIPDTMRRADA